MERNLSGFPVRQSSKTLFLNANDLLGLYNANHKVQKHLDRYLTRKDTKSFIEAIVADFQNTPETGELESVLCTKRGKYGGTWMHPYLFMDFAMWLSPEFKLTCVKWIYDNLIEIRHQAGDSFKEVNRALFLQNPNKVPPRYEYANEAKMINKIVFGHPDGGQRNKATEVQLKQLSLLQKADIKLIQEGKDYYQRYEKLKDLNEYIT